MPPGVAPEDAPAVGARVPPGVAPEDADAAYVGDGVSPAIGGDADPGAEDVDVVGGVVPPDASEDVDVVGDVVSPDVNVVGGIVSPGASEDVNAVGDVVSPGASEDVIVVGGVVPPDASEDDNVVGNVVPAESTDDGDVGIKDPPITLVVPGVGAGEEPSSTGQVTVSAGKACSARVNAMAEMPHVFHCTTIASNIQKRTSKNLAS